MIRFSEIVEQIAEYLSPEDVESVQQAYVFASAAHAGQMRLSGEPYFSHPLEVAKILVDFKLDAATIVTALLHDTVEDTDVSIDKIKELFGEEVAIIVAGVTKIGKMNFDSKQTAQAENIRKMILAMAQDIRVILVKLADRLHNMLTLDFQKPHKQMLIAQETKQIYAPLAGRIGLHKLKIKLEDMSLRYLQPDIYNQIKEGLSVHHLAGEDYIKNVCKQLENLFIANEINGRVVGRIKHIYSIYHKMELQNLNLDQIFDVIAFRVVVATIKDCYAALGVVHSKWRPVPGKFKDYISMPKANMYQSLHTTIIGPEGERVEIQIRTEEMHQFAENGVAAHWMYKEKNKLKEKDANRFTWLRQILDWEQDSENPREFLSALSLDLFQDEVYVFTPRGEVRELPDGATPIDFAYTIHSEVGNTCAGAKINGRLVPLTTKLKNGDTIEIIRDASRHPSRDWLFFLKTGKARTHVKHWLATEERSRSLSLGKDLLEKEFRKHGMNFNKMLIKGEITPVAHNLSFKSSEELISAVGYARITPRYVAKKFRDGEEDTPQVNNIAGSKTNDEKKKSTDGIVVQGANDLLMSFAQCCNPLPGDGIIGYISRGRGVVIHRTDCPNVPHMEVDRLLDVYWENQEAKPYPARIKIICSNMKGVLAEIASILSNEHINIDSGNFSSTIEGRTEITFVIEVRSSAQLYQVIKKLSDIKSVIEVIRITEW